MVADSTTASGRGERAKQLRVVLGSFAEALSVICAAVMFANLAALSAA